MFISLRTFRGGLLGVVALMSYVCIGLSVHILLSLPRTSAAQGVLIFIPAVVMIAAIAAIMRKPLFQRPQLVADEVAGAFVVSWNLRLYAAALSCFIRILVPVDHSSSSVLFPPYCLASVGMYTIGITTAAIVTFRLYDPHIWLRDIDARPSPFRIPALSTPSSLVETSWRTEALSTGQAHPSLCLPGCSCARKISMEAVPPAIPEMVHIPTSRESTSLQCSRDLRPRALVRIPNRYERNSLIFISLA